MVQVNPRRDQGTLEERAIERVNEKAGRLSGAGNGQKNQSDDANGNDRLVCHPIGLGGRKVMAQG
jgi:hypothetical protein